MVQHAAVDPRIGASLHRVHVREIRTNCTMLADVDVVGLHRTRLFSDAVEQVHPVGRHRKCEIRSCIENAHQGRH